ncbi:MAG: universal stress protein [Thermoplasmatales archaeon]
MKKEEKKTEYESEFSPKRIVVAFDASVHSIRALNAAISISKKYRTEITVIHCVQYPVMNYGDGNVYYNWDKYYAIEKENITKASKALIDGAKKKRIKINLVFTESTTSVAESILVEAKKVKPDLIVMGSRGLGGFKSLLLGSVSNAVVAHSTVPVLIIK